MTRYWAHKANLHGQPIGPRIEARDEAHAEQLAGRRGYIVCTGDYHGSLQWQLVVRHRQQGIPQPTYLLARQGGTAMERLMRVSPHERFGPPCAAIFGEGMLKLELRNELGWRCWDVDCHSEPAEMGGRRKYDAEFHLKGSPPHEDSETAGLVVRCVSGTTAKGMGGDVAVDLTVVLPALYGTGNLKGVDPRILEIAEQTMRGGVETGASAVEDGPPIEVMDFSSAAGAIIWEVNSYVGKKGIEEVVQVRGEKMERDQIARLVRTGLRHRPRGAPEFSGLQAFGHYYAVMHGIPCEESAELEGHQP